MLLKWNAGCILLFIVLSIAAPPVFHPALDHGSGTEIGTLDVCHASLHSLSAGSEMTWMNEFVRRHLPPAESRNAGSSAALFKTTLLSSQEEHPPEV